MKKSIWIFITIPFLLTIIFVADTLLSRYKNVDIHSGASSVHETQNSNIPFNCSSDLTNFRSKGELALDSFLESILWQKSSHNIYGSTIMYTAENMREINNARLPEAPVTISISDIIIMITLILMILFFTIKVF